MAMVLWYPLAWTLTLFSLASADYENATLQSALGGSYPDCPCIDVEHKSAIRSILENYRVDDNTLHAVGGYTVPDGYGVANCTPWDLPPLEGDPRCMLSPMPEYCKDSWCFVDPSNCKRNHLESQAFPGLSLSYHTCGSVGYQVRSRLRLDNKTIRIFVPGGLYLEKEVEGTRRVLLSMMKFAAPVLKRAGVTEKNIVYRKLSRPALERFEGHEYNACAWDTVIGNIDVCVGDFWDTPSRRTFGGIVTPAVFDESMYLYGKIAEPKSLTWVEIAAAPLKPFTAATWLMLLCATLLASFVVCCFERCEGVSHEDTHVGATLGHVEFRRLSISQSVMEGAYFGLSSFASGSPTDYRLVSTTSGKVLMVGFSIFITIVNASFTANLASLLVAKAIPKEEVTSFASALKMGVPVCVPDSHLAFSKVFDEVYGKNWIKGVTIGDDTAACFEMINSGVMDYFLASELVFGVARHAGQLCNVEVIGTPVVSMPTGWFVSRSVYQAIGEAITIEKAEGTWELIKKAFFSGDTCPKVDDSQINDVNQLTPENMAGTVFILLCFCALGFIILLVELGCGPKARSSSASPTYGNLGE